MTQKKDWNSYPPPVRDETSGCLRWQGPHHTDGYGVVSSHGLAHRIAWEREVGPIPEGLQIDHVKARGCVYNDCVEIEHLEPVTGAENVQRQGIVQDRKARTHCPRGHEYTPDNTLIKPGRNGRGERRECKRCRYDRNNARAKKLRMEKG